MKTKQKFVLLEQGEWNPIAIIIEKEKFEDIVIALKKAIKEHFNPDDEPTINIGKNDIYKPFRVEMNEDGENYNRELYLVPTAEY